MPSRADIYDGVIVGVGLLVMIFATKIVPEGNLQTILIAVGFLLVIGDAVLIEIIFEVITMHYPYIRLELQPSGKVFHLFLEKKPETVDITKVFKATKLTAHWEIEDPYYGRFKECVIHHELGFWGERVVPGPGYAFFQGYGISHPQTAKIVCHEYPYSSDRFKHLTIPAFMMAYAHGGDVNMVPLPLTSTLKAHKELVDAHPELLSDANPKSVKAILSAMQHYEAMTFAHVENSRTTQAYRAELLRLGGGEESRDSQAKGLLEIPRDTTLRALELFQGWYEDCGDFDRINQKYGRRRGFKISKWLAVIVIVAIGAVTTAFLSMNRETTQAISLTLSQLSTQIIIVVLALSAVAVAFLLTRRKSK